VSPYQRSNRVYRLHTLPALPVSGWGQGRRPLAPPTHRQPPSRRGFIYIYTHSPPHFAPNPFRPHPDPPPPETPPFVFSCGSIMFIL
jgi:hypothetical protein